MAGVLRLIVAVLAIAVALSGFRVSAQTHHVVGEDGRWGPAFDAASWLSGRVFRVGDKILFKNSGKEDSVVELRGPEEFLSCNLTNPIRMYTDRESHVALEEEGVRYFASGNLESCKHGLKLPVPVQAHSQYDPPLPRLPPPSPHSFGPPVPVHPPPAHWPPPSPPSGAARLSGASILILAGILAWCTSVYM